MAGDELDRKALAHGILDVIGGLGGAIGEVAGGPGVGTGIRLGVSGVGRIVDVAMPGETEIAAAPTSSTTTSQIALTATPQPSAPSAPAKARIHDFDAPIFSRAERTEERTAPARIVALVLDADPSSKSPAQDSRSRDPLDRIGDAQIARDYLLLLGWSVNEVRLILAGPGRTQEAPTYTTSADYEAAPSLEWRAATPKLSAPELESAEDPRKKDIAYWRRALSWPDLDPKLRAAYEQNLRKAGEEV